MRLLVLFTITILFNGYILNAQNLIVIEGNVECFTTSKNSKSNPKIVDTIVGQYRFFVIDSISKTIVSETYNGIDTLRKLYFINNIFTSNNFYSTSKKSIKFYSIETVDQDKEPMLLQITDSNGGYIYINYQWNSKDKYFVKRDKIVITYKGNVSLD